MGKINEIENIKNSKKELDEYFIMLLKGTYPQDYIISKIKHWAGVIAHDVSFADIQIREDLWHKKIYKQFLPQLRTDFEYKITTEKNGYLVYIYSKNENRVLGYMEKNEDMTLDFTTEKLKIELSSGIAFTEDFTPAELRNKIKEVVWITRGGIILPIKDYNSLKNKGSK